MGPRVSLPHSRDAVEGGTPGSRERCRPQEDGMDGEIEEEGSARSRRQVDAGANRIHYKMEWRREARTQ